MAKGLFIKQRQTGENSLAEIPASHPHRNPSSEDLALVLGGDSSLEVMINECGGSIGGELDWTVLANAMNDGNFPAGITVVYRGLTIPAGWVASTDPLELNDLYQYVAHLGRVIPLDLYEVPTLLYYSTTNEVFIYTSDGVWSLDLDDFTTTEELAKPYNTVESVTAIDGSVIVFFGAGNQATASALVESFDMSTKTWTSQTAMPAAREKGLAVYSPTNTKFYFFGGEVVSTSQDNVWEFTLGGAWTDLSGTVTLPTAAYAGSAIEANGLIYVGLAQPHPDEFYSIDPTNFAGGWTTLAVPPSGALPWDNNFLYDATLDVIVSFNRDDLYFYDITLDTWIKITSDKQLDWNNQNRTVEIGTNMYFDLFSGNPGGNDAVIRTLDPSNLLRRS